MTDEIVIGGDSSDIPPGTYPATLTAIATKYSEKWSGEFRAWKFTLDNGSVVEATSSMFTGPRSKPGRWIAALLGRVPETDETVTLVGRKCLVVVSIGKDEWPKVTEVVALPATSPERSAGTTLTAAEAEVTLESGSRDVAAQKRSGVAVPDLDF